MIAEDNFVLGILAERLNHWERRVAFTPSDVKKLIERGI